MRWMLDTGDGNFVPLVPRDILVDPSLPQVFKLDVMNVPGHALKLQPSQVFPHHRSTSADPSGRAYMAPDAMAKAKMGITPSGYGYGGCEPTVREQRRMVRLYSLQQDSLSQR
jgi:hypothetical protein